jgi:hypothetical protein
MVLLLQPADELAAKSSVDQSETTGTSPVRAAAAISAFAKTGAKTKS